MSRILLLALLFLLTGCSGVRSLWRDWGNADLAGAAAPGFVDGTWLLPPTDAGGEPAREAPEGWAPAAARWQLVAFLQPH